MNKVQVLRSKITDTQTAIEAILFSGGDTNSLRDTLANLERELANAEQAEADAARAAKQAEAERANQLAAEAVDAAHAGLVAAAGSTEVAGVAMPEPEQDPAIAAAAARLAAARDRLARDQAVHQEHHAKASALRERLNDKVKARDTLLARRNAGEERPGDGGEILLLAADIDSLRTLVATAEAAAEAHLPTVAQRMVNEAEAGLAAAQSRAVFRAKQARLQALEGAFLVAHAEMVQAGFAAGERNKFTMFRASQELRMITHGA